MWTYSHVDANFITPVSPNHLYYKSATFICSVYIHKFVNLQNNNMP